MRPQLFRSRHGVPPQSSAERATGGVRTLAENTQRNRCRLREQPLQPHRQSSSRPLVEKEGDTETSYDERHSLQPSCGLRPTPTKALHPRAHHCSPRALCLPVNQTRCTTHRVISGARIGKIGLRARAAHSRCEGVTDRSLQKKAFTRGQLAVRQFCAQPNAKDEKQGEEDDCFSIVSFLFLYFVFFIVSKFFYSSYYCFLPALFFSVFR